MRKLLLTLAFLFIPSVAWAQCTGVFPTNTICGNFSASPRVPGAFSLGGSVLTGPTSPTAGQIATYSASQFTIIDQTTITTSQVMNFTGAVSLSSTTSLGTVSISPPLPVSSGGTGTSTFTANTPLIGSGTAAIAQGAIAGNTSKFATTQTGAGAVNAGCAQFDGSGNIATTGVNCGAAGATSPGGSNAQIQYNSSGAFGGSVDWVILNSAHQLAANTVSATFVAPDNATWTTSSINGLAALQMGFSGVIIKGTGSGPGNNSIAFQTSGSTAIHLGDDGPGPILIIGRANPSGQGSVQFNNGNGQFVSISGDAGSNTTLDVGSAPGLLDGTIRTATLSASTKINLPDGGSHTTTTALFNTIVTLNPNTTQVPGAQTNNFQAFMDTTTSSFVLQGGAAQGNIFYPQWASLDIELVSDTGTIVGGPLGGLNLFQIGNERNVHKNFAGASDNSGPASQLFFSDIFVDGVITSLNTLTGGTSYTTGTYKSVPLTGGSGILATANVTISGGAVTSVSIVNGNGFPNGGGERYAVNDTLSATAANLGGTGSGFSIKVATISTSTDTGPQLLFNGTATDFVGFGQRDTTTHAVLHLGGSQNENAAWDYVASTGAVDLSLSGAVQFETNTGTSPFSCGVQAKNTSGTLAITTCNTTTAAPVNVAYVAAGTIYSSAGTQVPACSASTNGARAVVSDATSPVSYRGTYTAGGTLQVGVLCINGTGWITD